MRFNFTLSILFLSVFFSLKAQEECSPRYNEKVFDKVDYSGTYIFSTKPVPGGVFRDMRYDFYEPEGDTAALRPLIIIWHGGAFIDLFNKRSPDVILMAHEFVKRGYTVISADYRGVTNVLDLLKEKEVVQEVVRTVIDGNDLICKIMDDINNHGNPHRINPDAIFASGVSGGAILGLHLMYIKSLNQMPPKYKEWAMEVDNGAGEAALQNKFCSPNPIKGFISISGAILDTAWIQKSDMSLLIFHGGLDRLVPYEYAQPLFGAENLPYVYGGKLVSEQAQRVGLNSTFIDYPDRGHVPYMNITGTTPAEIIADFSKGLINEELFNKDMRSMTDFMFSQMECEKVVKATPIKNYTYENLQIYPNPTENNIHVQLDSYGKWKVELREISGKIIFSDNFTGQNYSKNLEQLPTGIYIIQAISNDVSNGKIYTNKLIVK